MKSEKHDSTCALLMHLCPPIWLPFRSLTLSKSAFSLIYLSKIGQWPIFNLVNPSIPKMEALDACFYNCVKENVFQQIEYIFNRKGLHRGELNTRARVLVGAPGSTEVDEDWSSTNICWRQMFAVGEDWSSANGTMSAKDATMSAKGCDHERQRTRP